ncbi:MAG: hypothetical protein FD135_3461 [Comamonadaceae bacterium]|nr:MAG: hypothetical protein FD135_3461 [Comamonadaceae bacterium]
MDIDRAYRCTIVSVQLLDKNTRSAMTALYLAVYEATSATVFEQDLSSKNEVLLLYFNAHLVGFTTLKVYPCLWRGSFIQVLYSGDTVVDRLHWGQHALSFAWVRHLGQIKRRHPEQRLVWFLLVKGHRTYRYLHVFARHFYPEKVQVTDDIADLAIHLAQEQFPSEYNPQSGVVEFTPSRGQLRHELAEPRTDELGRPGVDFFLQKNPGFRQGHELVCVCDVDESNMKPLTLRLFRQGCHA